jgi:hypothetical protein
MNVCAPGKKFENGSCLTIDDLLAIVKKNNNTNNNNNNNLYKNKNNINISNKKYLLNKVNNIMKDTYNCKDNDQECWIESNLVKNMKNSNIEKYTLRPTGPSSKYEWLSTTDINKVMLQYENEYKNFKFFGAVPYDFNELPQLEVYNLNFSNLLNLNKNKIGMVINLDTHNQSGSHWVALYSDLSENKIYFFDSFGKKPGKRITVFIRNLLTFLYNNKNNTHINIKDFLSERYTNNNNYDVRYNKKQHQFKNSECGVYSMNFIIRLLHGETFDNIVNNVTRDVEMNNCRKTYFRN